MIMYLQEQSSEPMLISVHDTVKISRKRSRSQIQHTTSETAPVTKRRRTIRSIRFANTVDTMPSPSSSTSADWYSDQEAHAFKVNMKRDVQCLAALCKSNSVATLDRTEYCSIGLERFCCSTETRQQSKILKQRRVRAVLDVQYGQRQMGVSDPEAIRRAAQIFSQPATKRAVALAARLC